jgi:hypothetical protein
VTFKYEPGQILVEGGRHYAPHFYRVVSRTAAYVATVRLEKEFTPAADQRPGFTAGSYLPTDQVHINWRLGPKRNRIKVDDAGNEFGAPAYTLWDGAPVPYSNC